MVGRLLLTTLGTVLVGGAAYVGMARLAPQADPWPRWLWFDSVDHNVSCPADHCVDAYLLQVWPQAAVGVGSPVLAVSIPLREVTATGSAPAYRLPLIYPPLASVRLHTPYVWTLTAVGAGNAKSARSAPTVETFHVVLSAATQVEVGS